MTTDTTTTVEHRHDWYVMDLCRDWCRICRATKRVCPRGHRHGRAT